MQKFNFDEVIERRNTLSVKYGLIEKIFGREDVIPMWVADMDFRVPECVSSAIKNRADHKIYGYSYHPVSFFQSAKEWVKKRHDWGVDLNWLSFSPGIVPGINFSVLEFTEPGDKIMIQPPVYAPFFHAIRKNNRQLVENRLILKNGRYHINFDDFENHLKTGVKMFILSNPHNPGGNVWTHDELKKMGELCLEYNTIIIADEIHSDIVYPGFRYIPMASISEAIANNTITFISPSKTFNIAGLSASIGIISNKEFRTRFNTMLDRLHMGNGNLFGTVAFEAAYKYGEEWLDQLLLYLEGNIVFLSDYFEKNIEGIKLIRPEGTFLAWLDCRELPVPDNEIHSFMIEKAKVAFNDGAGFGENGEGFQRLNFGCSRYTLSKALYNMKNALLRNH
ncbi:MAG: PatB family C-S lyase [Bacteroidales bacterium]